MVNSSQEFGTAYWKIAIENYHHFRGLLCNMTDKSSEVDQAACRFTQEKRALAGCTTIIYTARYLEFESARYLIANLGERKAENLLRNHRGIKGSHIPTQRWSLVACKLTGVDYLSEKKLKNKLDKIFQYRKKLIHQPYNSQKNCELSMPPLGISNDEFLIALNERDIAFNRIIEDTKKTVLELTAVANKHHERVVKHTTDSGRKSTNYYPPLVEALSTHQKYKPRIAT